MTPDRLSLRELNRATLERQLLLRRSARPAGPAVGHLAGLQAQAPLAPYVGLWTRLAGFGPSWLSTLLTERAVVRAHLMRNTVHLVTAEDFLRFRPLYQAVMERRLATNFGRNLVGVDPAGLREAAAALLGRDALTRGQLAERLAPRWPDHDPAALAYGATHLLPLVQVPPRGLWGESGQATWFLASAWLEGNGLAADPADPARAVEQLVLRYLAAYGPAGVADVQAWSGLSRLREVTERLGARLRPFTGPDGGRLLDLADAPPPSPTCRRRPGSCPNTTTCCSPSPNAAGSSRTAVRSRCHQGTVPPAARCFSTDTGRPTGRSPGTAGKPSWPSSRSSGWARPSRPPWRPRGSGSWRSRRRAEPAVMSVLPALQNNGDGARSPGSVRVN